MSACHCAVSSLALSDRSLNSYFANKRTILARNHWEDRKIAAIFILTQRKMGKTTFLGQHAVVHAMNTPKQLNIACISRTLDQVR